MASEAPKARFVRCPICRRLLMECVEVPVYKCGGCGTILQARTGHASHRRVPIAVLCENPPNANTENNSNEEESNFSEAAELAACKENVDVEAGSTFVFPNSTGQSAVMGQDTTSVSSAQQSQVDGSWKLSRHGSVNSSVSYKSVESAENVINSEEETFDGNAGHRQIHSMGTSSFRSSHAYDSSVSSGDDISGKHQKYQLLSRRTFRNRRPSEPNSTATKGAEEDTSVGKRQQDIEMCNAGALGISSLKQRSSSRYAAHTSDPDDSVDSENLYPVQNEVGSDHLSSLSRSPSRESTSLEDFPCNSSGGVQSTGLGSLQSDQMELPRRKDLLRDQPARPYAGARRGDRSVAIGGNRHDGHRPLFSCNFGSEQVPNLLYTGDMMSQWPSRVAQQYQSSGMPFSRQGNGSCLPHHHHSESCNIRVQLPTNVHCRGCSSHTWFHPSIAANPGCSTDRDAALRHRNEASDHDWGRSPCKEKRQYRKRRHCRPVSGGAPFVVCNSCFELLQLPVDLLVSRRRCHKLRCGACFQVLTFLYDGRHVVPRNSSQSDPSSGVADKAKHEASAIQSHGSPQEDPVSYSEEYGPLPSQSYPTDGEPAPYKPRSSPAYKGKGRYELTMGPPLHHLLGDESARNLIFVPSDEDERYGSVNMSRFYRTSDDMDFVEGYGGTATSSTRREHSAVGYSPNHLEIREEKEQVRRLAGARGGPQLHGLNKGGIDELNHGLENMNMRTDRNGRRPW